MKIHLVIGIADGKFCWVEACDSQDSADESYRKAKEAMPEPVPDGMDISLVTTTFHPSAADTTVKVEVDAQKLIDEINVARERLEERVERLKQMGGHVKILLSTNYNNFEFSLPIHAGMSVCEMNRVRKTVQRLCDEAVRQFREALKANQELMRADPDRLEATVEHIQAIPRSAWSPEMKAAVKAWDDYTYRVGNPYDYEDDPEWLRADESNKKIYGNFDGAESTIQAANVHEGGGPDILEEDENESSES